MAGRVDGRAKPHGKRNDRGGKERDGWSRRKEEGVKRAAES